MRFWPNDSLIRLFGLASLALFLSSCGGADRPLTKSRLVDALPAAEVRREPGLIDLGTGAADLLQLDGWSWNERLPSGETFVWGLAPASRLSFFLLEARPLSMRLRAMPYDDPSSPQVLTIKVNGGKIDQLELRPGWQDLEFHVPGQALRSGANELALEFSRATSPRALGLSKDRRHLTAALDWIDLGLAPVDLPSIASGQDLLHLPGGSQVDFFFDLPSGGSFVAELARESPIALTIEALADGESEPLRASLSDKERSAELSLPTGISRLRLKAPASKSGEPSQVVTLRGATVSTEVPEPKESLAGERLRGCGGEMPPHVFVYLIDTLRADRLSVYGHRDEVSPELAAFAADALTFDVAIAQSSWTRASVASIFTGLWPWVHGVNTLKDRLPESLPSLPELMQEAGYRTAGVAANPNVSEAFGFTRGFDEFVLLEELTTPSSAVHSEMLAMLDRFEPGERLFGYLHTIDPHAPYAPPPQFRQKFSNRGAGRDSISVEALADWQTRGKVPEPGVLEEVTALYDAEIAYNDSELGLFLEELRRRGLYENALIVVVSDHGEEFYDHGGWVHGKTLYREVINVPLMIKFPAGNPGQRAAFGGARRPGPAQHIDLLPTVAECAGFELPAGLQGRSLAAVEANASDDSRRPVFSYLHYSRYDGASVLLDDWKLVAPVPGALDVGRELYNIVDDPAEQVDLEQERPVVAGYLASLLRLALLEKPVQPGETVEIDSETAQQLRALGYLN